MSSGIIEAGAGSMSGSLIAYFLLKLWKRWKRQIKVKGLLINDYSNWEMLEAFSNEEILFINLKKALGRDYPADLSRADVRLKVFPCAKKYLNVLKDSFKKKTFVVMSDDLEMLNFVGIKNKYIKTILPSETLIQELVKTNKETDYNKLKLQVVSTLDKKDTHIIDSNDDIMGRVRDIYNVCVK